jgi:hypothetical protein
MGTDNTSWLEAVINKLERETRSRRDRLKGNWDGYSSSISPMLGTEESIRNDVRRRERMAEAMYDV